MSHYSPYPVYKDSGVEWIGEVPEHWKVLRFKYVIWLQRGHDLPVTEFQEGKYPVCGSNGCIGYNNQYTTKGPGVTIGRSGSVGEVNYIDMDYWAHNTALYVKEFRRAIPKYSFYLLKVLDVKYLSGGTAVGTLNRNNIHDLPIACPLIDEQCSIAAFLDQETAHIDALIAKKIEFIELLSKKRRALITHAVTKGLNPNAKMKDSGVEWIGAVPEHWKVQAVKHIYITQLGKMIAPKPLSEDDMHVPYHRAQTVQWENIHHGLVERMWASANEIASYSIQKGDLLICEGGDVCRAAVCNIEPCEPTIIQNSIHRVRSRGIIAVEWLLRLMQLVRSSEWIDVLCNKNTIVHFTSEKLDNMRIPIPPQKEHFSILAYLDRETAHIDTLIAKTQLSIDLLKKRRLAFITAAVTGKIDLREVVI
ncbi:MAG: restriction endonuclease subunit S [Syntrophobacteraceae bacterium]